MVYFYIQWLMKRCTMRGNEFHKLKFRVFDKNIIKNFEVNTERISQ